MARHGWTRDELIVAFNLYCKIPFGRIHNRNPLIINLAKAIGRTPSAVSWKLANFARLDPFLRRRAVSGATHGAKAEVQIWEEFNNDWERLSFESEQLLKKFTGGSLAIEAATAFPEGKTRAAFVHARVNQGFFRAAVLAAYGSQCCITGLSIPQLLNASHIVPWTVDIKNRANPRNGLCLNAIHDRAFDCGLLTVTPELKVRVSPKVRETKRDASAEQFLLCYEGTSVRTPSRFVPETEFLLYHNEKVFQGGV